MINRVWLTSRGFTGFDSVAGLRESEARVVPRASGVYAVFRPSVESPQFLERSVGGHFKGKDPSVPREKLTLSWVDESQVVYLGKAGRQDKGPTLRSRIRQYLNFGAGRPVGHWGGRYIWQLIDSLELQFAWQPTPSREPRSVERDLINEFECETGKLPFANLVR
jgi:hypothetical protein